MEGKGHLLEADIVSGSCSQFYDTHRGFFSLTCTMSYIVLYSLTIKDNITIWACM